MPPAVDAANTDASLLSGGVDIAVVTAHNTHVRGVNIIRQRLQLQAQRTQTQRGKRKHAGSNGGGGAGSGKSGGGVGGGGGWCIGGSDGDDVAALALARVADGSRAVAAATKLARAAQACPDEFVRFAPFIDELLREPVRTLTVSSCYAFYILVCFARYSSDSLLSLTSYCAN
jgi:hypothetical protein